MSSNGRNFQLNITCFTNGETESTALQTWIAVKIQKCLHPKRTTHWNLLLATCDLISVTFSTQHSPNHRQRVQQQPKLPRFCRRLPSRMGLAMCLWILPQVQRGSMNTVKESQHAFVQAIPFSVPNWTGILQLPNYFGHKVYSSKISNTLVPLMQCWKDPGKLKIYVVTRLLPRARKRNCCVP